MTGNVRIVITSPDGQTLRRVPLNLQTAIRWSFRRFGGMWDATVNTAARLRQLRDIQQNDRLEIYVDGPNQLTGPDGQQVPEWRGWLNIKTRDKENAENYVLQFFGAIHYVRGFLLDQDFASAFPSDVSYFFGGLGNKWVLNALGPGGLPLIGTVQSLVVGVQRNVLTGRQSNVGAALDDLQRTMGNLAGYGCDVDPLTMGNRLYMRPNEPLDPPTHAYHAPSQKLSDEGVEEDGQNVVTVLQFKGGTPDYPQLLHNGNFALPVRHITGSDNKLTNGDFETHDSWAEGGAAWQGVDFNGVYKHQPFTGQKQYELDHVDEYIEQIGAGIFPAGQNFTLAIRAAKGFGSQTAAGFGLLEWRDAGNNPIGAPVTFPITPASTSWQYFSLTVPVPAGAARYRVRFQCNNFTAFSSSNNGGLYLDAAELYNASELSQDGWQTMAYGTAGGNPHFNFVNWVYQDATYEGSYAVMLDVVANDAFNQDAHLEPLNQARATVTGQQTVRFRFRYRSPVNGTVGIPKMILYLKFYAADGHETNIPSPQVVIPAQGVNAGWQVGEILATANGDSTSVQVIIDFRSNGQIVIDTVSLMDSAAPTDPYQAEGNFQTVVKCNDADLAAAYPDGAAIYGALIDGPAGYGQQVQEVDEDAILLRTDALAYADNFFRGSGPYKRPPVILEGVATRFFPGESFLLLGPDAPYLMDAALPIAVIERNSTDTLKTNLSVEREERDSTELIEEIAERVLKRRGPDGMGNGGTYSGQSNTGGGASISGPSFYGTSAHDANDATLHDAYTPVGGVHILAIERQKYNSIADEVVNARTAADGTVYSDLKTHINSIASQWLMPKVNALPDYSTYPEGYVLRLPTQPGEHFQRSYVCDHTEGGWQPLFCCCVNPTDDGDLPYAYPLGAPYGPAGLAGG